MKVGDRVYHRKNRRGVVLEAPAEGNWLIEWETDVANRQTKKLSRNQTHVSRTSLSLINAPDWSLAPGFKLLRKDLHERFGGSGQGGISPAGRSNSVFIFTDPSTGEQHGYHDAYDEKTGVLLYTGEGQKGDQQIIRGNRAILEHRKVGSALRVFQGSSGEVQYLGEFGIDESAPFSYRDAPSTDNGPLRTVIVFKLTAIGGPGTPPPVRASAVVDVKIEERNTERALVEGGREAYEIERRESALVQLFIGHMKRSGHECIRKKIKPSPAETLFTDIFVPDLNLLIEAKGSTSRDAMRGALGQLLDYRRYLLHPICAVLLPEEPRPDLLDLALANDMHVYWPVNDGFEHRIPTGA